MSQLISVLLFCGVAGAQDARPVLTGTVADPSGDRLAGTTVTLPGTYFGVFTDENGEFSIELREESPTVRFQFTGFGDCTVDIEHGAQHIDVVLQEKRWWKRRQEPCAVTWQ